MIHEVNLDGLVGPTHNYAGLSRGNLASIGNKGTTSSPRKAALQGLEKMKMLADLGVKQMIMPPQPRPALWALKNLGFNGSLQKIITDAGKHAPEKLAAAYSSSAMWTANAATITPGIDSKDKKTHITPANLMSNFHRSIETDHTYQIFKNIFSKSEGISVHEALIDDGTLMDEGAANHSRICRSHSENGLHLFVYSRNGRQTYEASKAIAQRHLIPEEQLIFAEQNPYAIDVGVFHNDVISTGNENLFLYHELAFTNTNEVINDMKKKYQNIYDEDLHVVKIPESLLSIKESVSTYLFNCQIITKKENHMLLLAPKECEESENAQRAINFILESKAPINEVKYIDLRESMKNGGGPACLRLRLPLNELEIDSIPRGLFLNDESYNKLRSCINKHYRESLNAKDLLDSNLINESKVATEAIYQILGMLLSE
jgi:succinylarginine dihydrolase